MPNDFDLRRLAPDLDEVSPGLLQPPALQQPRDAAIFYPADGNAGCLAVEEDSWWFAHRNHVLVDLLERFPPGPTLLDVGGGNGCVARALELAGHRVVLVEPGPDGIRAARQRGLRYLIQATLDDARLSPGIASAAGLFDVLEHVPNEEAFLATLRATLAPQARLFLTVPAHAWLWSHADVSAGHQRRYSRWQLIRVLEGQGFRVEFASYFFSFLTLPLWLGRTLPDKFRSPPVDRQTQSEREHQPPAGVAQATRWMCAAERYWLKSKALPMGASVVAVARKGE